MGPKWHIAFCNVTFTEYGGVSYRDYYASPATMLETQLAAKEHAEQRFGVGRFITPLVDSPGCTFASFLGMSVVTPEEDELAYIDTTRPLTTNLRDVDQLRIGDPREEGLMAARWEAWQYYTSRGYRVGFGGAGGGIVTVACEITNNGIMPGFIESPDDARRALDFIADAQEVVLEFGASLTGVEYSGSGYIGDDYAGLLSPAMFEEFVIPVYQRLYADQTSRFMHSELLRADHLRIARDELGITDFHGAGCEHLTLEEMRDTVGEQFWTQLTPQEMLEFTPAQIDERIREFAECGARYVQLYPGRGTPDRNMEAAIASAQKYCAGGPHW